MTWVSIQESGIDYESALHGQIAEVIDDSPDNFNWSCVHATSYTPAG